MKLLCLFAVRGPATVSDEARSYSLGSRFGSIFGESQGLHSKVFKICPFFYVAGLSWRVRSLASLRSFLVDITSYIFLKNLLLTSSIRSASFYLIAHINANF